MKKSRDEYGAASGAAIGGVSTSLSYKLMGEDFDTGFKYGALMGGISGALGGGVSGYQSSLAQGLNVWTGRDVEIGRNQFSLNNKPFPENELYYVDEKGRLESVSQYNNPTNRRINTRFESKIKRVAYTIDLEDKSIYPLSESSPMSQSSKIKGYAGIEYKHYLSGDKSVTFTSNTGFNKTVTSVPGKFTFNPKGVTNINANIYGTPYNIPNEIPAPFSYKIIVRCIP